MSSTSTSGAPRRSRWTSGLRTRPSVRLYPHPLSTFEHIGFDEEVRDPDKVPRAIAHVTGLLAPGGELLISAPLGYNVALNALAQRNELGFDEMLFLKRVSDDNRWIEVSASEATGAQYGSPFPAANAVLFGRTRVAADAA